MSTLRELIPTADHHISLYITRIMDIDIEDTMTIRLITMGPIRSFEFPKNRAWGSL